MFWKPKDGRPIGCGVGPNALENRSSVMKGMTHRMDTGLGPVIQFSHVPEILRFGKMGIIKHVGLLLIISLEDWEDPLKFL